MVAEMKKRKIAVAVDIREMKWVLALEAECGNGNEKWRPGYLVEETEEEVEEERVCKERSTGKSGRQKRGHMLGWGLFAPLFVVTLCCVLCCSFNDIILPLNCCGCVRISYELLFRYIVSLELLFFFFKKKKLSNYVILNY